MCSMPDLHGFRCGDTVEIVWLGRIYRGVVTDVRSARRSSGKTWLWIEIEHDGRLLRLGYHTGEVTRV